MLFHSSLRKDLARNFGATLVILVTIVMTIILIRTLGQASRGGVNPSEVMLVMGFSVLGQMPTIITLSLFISCVATLSRMYGESEMVIWFASGKGLAHFVRPLLRFSWPIFLFITLLSLLVLPWTQQQIQDLRERYEKRNDVERIAPGQFQESAGGNRVFFIDKDSPGQRFGTNVFVSTRDGQFESVTTASQGRVEFVGTDRFLYLENGQQWLTLLKTGETRLTQFERYQLLIDTDNAPPSEALNSRQKTTWQLLQEPTPANQGELTWRIGLLFTAINMVLLALALSAVNPRVGRSYHLGLALFVFVAYYNLLTVGQNWVSTGRVEAMPFMLLLHGGVLLLALMWLTVRHMNWSWRTLMPTWGNAREGHRMRTVRRLLYGEIIRAVLFVGLGFLALFLFFDLVDELQVLSRYSAQGYQIQHALLFIALKTPDHIYELLPISVLIGSIFVMARLAQSSEFTILRTGGLEPTMALSALLKLGLVFSALTFFFGDYAAPWAERQAHQIKAPFVGQLTVGQTGAWLREKQDNKQFAVNVRRFDGIAVMQDVRIHEFNDKGQLLAITTAQQAEIKSDMWLLNGVVEKSISQPSASDKLQLTSLQQAQKNWPTEISADMVAAALLSPDRMGTWELFRYMRHLAVNNQNAQRYEIEFWRKIFYPLSCLVMLVLALPFAYLHFRSGQIAGHVFGGVLAGISFSLLNNVFSFIGNLQNWQPLLTSAAPALIYSAISLAAFWWMVLRR